ncbi:hypothetical protein P8452_47846 [Trifolium repens]|nr:hypothetical protein P8452_47846 [Trifolium repens]
MLDLNMVAVIDHEIQTAQDVELGLFVDVHCCSNFTGVVPPFTVAPLIIDSSSSSTCSPSNNTALLRGGV